jgi:lysophospholipase L1-like esterase
MKENNIMTQLRIGFLRSVALTAAMAVAVGIVSKAAAAEPLVKSGDKVIFLGDSITAGGTWPGGYITLTALGLKAAGIDIKASNAGVGGNRSREMLARLDRDVLNYKPNWVLVSCGVNDSNTGEYGVPADEYRDNVAKIVERSQAAGAKVMVLTNTVGREDFSQIMRDVVKEKKCVLADLRVPYQKASNDNPWAQMANDGVHPNARGYMVMSMCILRAFGLDDGQMAKAEKALLDQPNTFEFSPYVNIRISLRQAKALDEIALKRKMRTDEMLRLLFVADLFPGISTKTEAEIEAFLDSQKGKDPWAASREKLDQRLNALLAK